MPTATAEQLSSTPRASSSPAAPHTLLIGGERAEAADGRTFETIDPATGEPICEVAQAGAEDVDRAVAAARAALDGPAAQGLAVEARRAHVRARRADQGERRRARRARVARQRQAAGRGQGRHRRLGRPPALLRGLADEDRGRDDPGLRPRPVLLHAARAGRRLRPDRALELPAADGGLEDLAGARGRLPADPEARRADAADRAAPRRAGARGGLPRGHRQRAHRRRRDRRRARRPPRRRQGRLHRLDRGRPRDRRQVRPGAEAGDARARRQEPQHHPSRRRPRGRGQGLLPRHLLQLRPGLQRGLAAVRPGRASSTR